MAAGRKYSLHISQKKSKKDVSVGDYNRSNPDYSDNIIKPMIHCLGPENLYCNCAQVFAQLPSTVTLPKLHSVIIQHQNPGYWVGCWNIN